jgi:hypothetical protein
LPEEGQNGTHKHQKMEDSKTKMRITKGRAKYEREKQRNRETEKQRNRETEKQRNRETEKQVKHEKIMKPTTKTKKEETYEAHKTVSSTNFKTYMYMHPYLPTYLPTFIGTRFQ